MQSITPLRVRRALGAVTKASHLGVRQALGAVTKVSHLGVRHALDEVLDVYQKGHTLFGCLRRSVDFLTELPAEDADLFPLALVFNLLLLFQPPLVLDLL